jgi:polyphenol oxidase
MNKIESGILSHYQFENLKQFSKLNHIVTFRHGGISEGAFRSFNIGFGTDDNLSCVLQNRILLSKQVKLPLQNFVFLNQVHENTVAVLTEKHKGSGAFDKNTAILKTDAAITSCKDLFIFVMGADCVPVLFFDPVNEVIGACHSGWRGTVKQIAVETIQKMASVFGSKPHDVIVGIGPSIGGCCYEVGGEVIDAVLRIMGTTEGYISFQNEKGSSNFNLQLTLEHQLMNAGVLKENIEQSGICTNCNSNEFFSSRFDKGNTGRFGAGISLC